MKKNIFFIAIMFVSVFVHAQTCSDDKHPHAIDLGLPSGTKWSCCNMGANKPEEYGTYYAYGEIEEREIYDDKSYRDVIFRSAHVLPDYDVATVKWKGSWRMPESSEIEELFDNCTSEWKTVNDIKGRLFTGKNGNSVFLPAGGKIILFSNESVGKLGHYWTSSQSGEKNAWYFFFHNENVGMHDGRKYQGLLIRPVSK